MLILVFRIGGSGFDFFAYWAVDPAEPYRIVDRLGAFHYAPPLAFLAAPLRWLPFDLAYVAWTGLNALILVWIARSWALAWCAFPPVASELYHGNIHLLLAATVVLGFRRGSVWAVPVLTKLTPGIGLLWPLIRGQWRVLTWAVGATAAITLLSLAAQGPGTWVAWIDHLIARVGRPEDGGALIDISLLVRLPIAIVITVWGALTGRRWAVPVGMALAMPLLWFHSLAMLVALGAPSVRACEPAVGSTTGSSTNVSPASPRTT